MSFNSVNITLYLSNKVNTMSYTTIKVRCNFCSTNFNALVNGLVRVQQQYEATCPSCTETNGFMNKSGWTDFIPNNAVEARAVNSKN